MEAHRRRSTLDFRVAAEPQGSYLTLEFRLQPRLLHAALHGPGGQVIDLTPRLRRLPAAQTPRPERGDLYLMTDILRDPRPGAWQLVLEHESAAARHTIFWQAVHQPRFAASLSVVGGDLLRSGVDVDVLLELTDYGMPAPRAQPGLLSLAAPDGSHATYPLRAGTAPGRSEARIPVRGTGSLEIAAQPVWPLAPGQEATQQVSRRWQVEAGSPTPAARLSVQLERDTRGCLESVSFTLPWQADAAGTYVLSVLLGTLRITGSTDLDRAGPALLRAVLRGSRLASLPPGLVHLADGVDVVRASGASDVLMRRGALPLSAPFDPAQACR